MCSGVVQWLHACSMDTLAVVSTVIGEEVGMGFTGGGEG
jgi:hypothetical protein